MIPIHTRFSGGVRYRSGARLVSKRTPSQIVLRQSNSQQKTPSKRFASWILWGISSAGRALAWHARGHRFDPAILHPKSTVLRWKYSAFLFAEAGFWGCIASPAPFLGFCRRFLYNPQLLTLHRFQKGMFAGRFFSRLLHHPLPCTA